jgi:hypothetical protein
LPLNKNTRELKDVISAIKNNPDGNSFLFLQPGVQDISGQTTSSVRKELFNQISDIANEGGKAKIKMSVQYLPEWFDKTATASRSTFESNVVEFPGQTNMLSGDLHKEGVLIGFTLDEDAYREKNGLKKTDVVPEADRTVWVKAPATLSALSPALSKMYKSPEQLYMQKPGSQFSLDLGPKGSALIRRNSDGFLYVKPAPIVLDPVSGQVVSYKPVNGDAEWIKVTKPNGENVPVSINDSPGDVQDATGVILDYMNQAYQRTQQAIKYYNKTYARSNTNTQ